MTIKASKELTIINKLGLHARAATKLVELTQQFNSEITITGENKTVKANSVMGLLMLAGAQGKQVKLECIGDDAHEALNAIEDLFENKFEEVE